jgi:hypothetical protein
MTSSERQILTLALLEFFLHIHTSLAAQRQFEEQYGAKEVRQAVRGMVQTGLLKVAYGSTSGKSYIRTDLGTKTLQSMRETA